MSRLFVSQPPFLFQIWQDFSGVEPKLRRSSWRAFASTHLLMLYLLLVRRLSLFAIPHVFGTCHSSLWAPPFPLRAPALIPLSRQDTALAHLDSLHLTIWCFEQTAPLFFLLAKTARAYLPTVLCVALWSLFSFLFFSAGPLCSSFSAEACAILHALCWSRQHQQIRHFSSPPI